jgi:hypothetical protein
MHDGAASLLCGVLLLCRLLRVRVCMLQVIGCG